MYLRMHFISMHENTFYLDAFWKHFFCRLGPVAVTNGACTHCMSCHRRAGVTLKKQCLGWIWRYMQKFQKDMKKKKKTVAFIYQHDPTVTYLYVCVLRLAFPFSKSLFARAPVLLFSIHPSLSPVSLQVCLSVFSHLCSLFSAGGGSSGSGNRSVRCHYSSNSVIRHRALPAHAACYGADTARAVRRLGRDSIWHAQRWARAGGVQGCARVEMRSRVGRTLRGHPDNSG